MEKLAVSSGNYPIRDCHNRRNSRENCHLHITLFKIVGLLLWKLEVLRNPRKICRKSEMTKFQILHISAYTVSREIQQIALNFANKGANYCKRSENNHKTLESNVAELTKQ